jgi:predicted lipoprotein with Yx(FWY)xxD motif
MRMRQRLTFTALVTAIVIGIALVAAGCSSGYGTTPPASTPSTGTVGPASEYSVDVATSQTLGQYLVDQHGMTLYWTTADSAGMSNVPDNLLSVWPVFYVETVIVPSTLMASDFGSITRSDGSMQTTFKDWPLYYYASDTAAGDTAGQGVGGRWSVVSPDATGPMPS